MLNVINKDKFLNSYIEVCRYLWTTNSLKPFVDDPSVDHNNIKNLGMGICVMRQIISD